MSERKTIINCKCNKQLSVSNCVDNHYRCPYCKRVWVKEYYIEDGEYKYTFNLKENLK